jgi:hypothetical protein
MAIQVSAGNPLSDVGARVFNNANLSINNATETVVTYNNERWDTDDIHSTVSNTGRLTAQTAGKYIISAVLAFAGGGGTLRYVLLKLNGSTNIAWMTAHNPNAGLNVALEVTTEYDMNIGDYVETVAYQNSGGALDVIYSANTTPEFMMQLAART